ncbi:flagellar biosynthesis protein FlhF [Luteimonas cucumeris]|uniref:Flagellar biosynthesis protein FlhF n=1 Tax=Luteimonas cucumeris TaxID=985012 RepID=A0A562L572_9GAMM|nr:flagellar biosynthesis protein FlhF [Luteimonas cucumeris]TWI02812.1 flagellar biosynthesis protein FlhF [Luteimonas cucumeris]
MKIKRFIAPDMRTAFAMVRQEQGPDAVILSNRVTDDGIEIVAATNYDEALVQRTLEAMRPSTPVAPATASTLAEIAPPLRQATPAVSAAQAATVRAPSPAEAAAAYFHPHAASATPTAAAMTPATETPPSPSFAAQLAATLAPVSAPAQREMEGDELPLLALPRIVPPQPLPPLESAAIEPALTVVADNTVQAREDDQQLVQMRSELASMREMIEREMHRLTDERLRGSPVRMQAMDLMEEYGFDPCITREVALQIPADTELHRGRGLMLGLLSRKLPIIPVDPLQQGGVIALVGPTGAGKTTTIAKLAASFAATHNARDVALVTTDTVRVGGREQLHSYGRQLGIAVHEADSDAGLAQTLQRLRDYKLVLIDTAGLGQRDRNLVGQLNWLRTSGQVHTLLVLPANSHFCDLDEVVRRFGNANPQGVVLTKLDETGRLGSALSVVVNHQLPIAWITDGQHVPRDLHRANSAHLVLRLDQLRRQSEEPCHAEASHVA